jgi:hypothetical protein
MRYIGMALLIALAATLFACGGGGDDESPTNTPSPAATSEPTPGNPSDEIRSIDLANAPAVERATTETGGTFDQTSVLYADVTGDDIEDAIVPLSSGGTLGNVALIVLTLDGAGVSEELRVEANNGIVATVEDGHLVTTEPVPGVDDPECCPSQIRTTTYAGDGGTGLTQLSSVVEPAGSGITPEPTEG